MICDVCNAKVTELRRGRCWGCYNRWVDARPVGLGARCCVCSERRREQLRSVELLGAWMPMCFACSGRAMQLVPLPRTVAGIREALRRERRHDDRRGDRKDTRVFQYDRRNDDRRRGRSPTADDCVVIDDNMIVEIEVVLDQLDDGEPADASEEVRDDLTRIRDMTL